MKEELIMRAGALTVPLVKTLVFLEEGHLKDGTPCYFFNEIRDDDESPFFIRREDAPDILIDGPRLVERLTKCFARERQAGGG
jgi:hypothetical protein